MGGSSLSIEVSGQQDRTAAVRLVLGHLPEASRGHLIASLASLHDEPLGPFDALIVGKLGKKVEAAAWVQPQPGRTASLWMPQTTGKLSEAEATSLIQRAVEIADAKGVSMTQVLLETDNDPHAASLPTCGFKFVAKLLYKEWAALAHSQAEDASPARVEFEPHAANEPERLKEIIQQTYVDTLDCPRMEGWRNIDDTLAGYQQVGEHDPALWFRLRLHGGDAGVLLLAEHPASKQMELAYMGVTPIARGHGVGAAAIRHAKRMTVARGAERLVLAVDAANTPAMRLYQSAGFSEWAARVVYVRPLHG